MPTSSGNRTTYCPLGAVDRSRVDRNRQLWVAGSSLSLPHRRRTFPGVRRRVRILGWPDHVAAAGHPRDQSTSSRSDSREIGPGCRNWRRNIARCRLIFRRADPGELYPRPIQLTYHTGWPGAGSWGTPIAVGYTSVAAIRSRVPGSVRISAQGPILITDRRIAPVESTAPATAAPVGDSGPRGPPGSPAERVRHRLAHHRLLHGPKGAAGAYRQVVDGPGDSAQLGGGPFRQQHHGRLRTSAQRYRHHREIHHRQPVHPVHPESLVDHRPRIVGASHPAGTREML